MSESTDNSRNFRIKKRNFWLVVLFLSMVILVLFSWIIYTAPRLSVRSDILADYKKKKDDLDRVGELVAEFEQVRMLNRHVREVLFGSIEDPTFPGKDLDISGSNGENLDFEYYDENIFLNVPNSLPLVGYVTQGFNLNPDPFSVAHPGVDIIAPEGDVIFSAAGGLVVFSEMTLRYGNLVIIDHFDGYFTFYGHNERNLVSANSWVKRNQPIGILGNTGQSTGPHLHFEIWKDGLPVDPVAIVLGLERRDISGN